MMHEFSSDLRTKIRYLGLSNNGLPTLEDENTDLLYAQKPIQSFFGNRENVLIIPNAADNPDVAFKRHSEALANVAGVRSFQRLDHLMRRPADEIKKVLSKVEAVYKNGGNTFRSADELLNGEFPWLEYLTEMMLETRPYGGVSAGFMIVADGIETCRDPKIANETRGFNWLQTPNFKLHPHMDSQENNDGSTEANLKQDLVPGRTILAINDGTWVRLESGQFSFEGDQGARALIMRFGEPSRTLLLGSQRTTDITYLLA